jgi:hypothetical protein
MTFKRRLCIPGDINAVATIGGQSVLVACKQGGYRKSIWCSSAAFDPNRSTEKNRGKENILYLPYGVVDFKDGALKPEALPELFPDLQMVITSSSGTRGTSQDLELFIGLIGMTEGENRQGDPTWVLRAWIGTRAVTRQTSDTRIDGPPLTSRASVS